MKPGAMNFFQVKSWKKNGKIIHGFGSRGQELEKSIRQHWVGKSVQYGEENFPLVSLRQVHGDRVVIFDGDARKIESLWKEEGDSLITRATGFALGVFTADCLPILLYDPARQAIGIVHAGWRGTAREVSKKAVEKMKAVFHSRSADILAAMGPCIGPCCYEVDGPVKEAFENPGFSWESISRPGGEGKWFLDLYLANSVLLEASGVRKENIESLKTCTSCRRDTFYSYRNADKKAGRQLNYIALRRSVAKIPIRPRLGVAL
jgi:YfiH family protein